MVLGSAEVDHSLSLSHRTSRNLDFTFLSGCQVGVNLAFFFCLSGILHYCIPLCDTVVCTLL